MRTGQILERVPAAGARALAAIGVEFHGRGWSVGTSSNYSVVLSRDPLRLLITASGKDKGRLGVDDFVIVDDAGRAIDPSMPKPSAETMLHAVLARDPGIGSVLHTHSIWATLLSDRFAAEGALAIEGYEMLKGLSGVGTHEHTERIPIFANTQDIPDLARRLEARRADPVRKGVDHGFLLARHGLYTWGADLGEARRHVEVLEFLFEVVGRRLTLESARR